MARGTIRRLMLEKGFGFVRDSQDGLDHFFHRSAVLVPFETLHEGQEVEFDTGRSDKGPRAENVKPVES